MSEKPSSEHMKADNDSVEEAGRAWDEHMNKSEEEKAVIAKAEKEKKEALDAEKVRADAEEAEEREKAIEEAGRAWDESMNKSDEEKAASTEPAEPVAEERGPDVAPVPPGKGGTSGGANKASVSYGPLGITGDGPSWMEKNVRDLARGTFNLFDKALSKVEGWFVSLQKLAGSTSFDFWPWSNPDKVNDEPAIKSHLDEKKK